MYKKAVYSLLLCKNVEKLKDNPLQFVIVYLSLIFFFTLNFLKLFSLDVDVDMAMQLLHSCPFFYKAYLLWYLGQDIMMYIFCRSTSDRARLR